MFEDSLVESRVLPISSTKRWTALASISLQFAVAAVVIALPLLQPEAMQFHEDSPKVLLPLLPKPPAPPVRVERVTNSSSVTSPDLPRTITISSLLPTTRGDVNDEPALVAIDPGMGTPSGLPAGLDVGESVLHPSLTIAPTRAANKMLHVSSGVSAGMLIAPIRPVYPAIAKAAHVEGTVVVEAVISRTGTIESLHVISGPAMLQTAAIEAIRAARYQPYRLNGDATEVQTTITVNFRLGA
ncbi:energy transducer TonB [Tunturiibacter lichenicola]|uniref:energy transducer TonB n=1 Tax=Tunturiibacter lichenicola TaxID=2051959 RepID=UPI0021B42BD1|nr:energy transducer TonB [Edaphobacter lichenicola]